MIFKEQFESTLTEKAKFSKAGGGYVESFMNSKMGENALEEIASSISEFIDASEDYAEEEGMSTKEQKEAIIDDLLSYIYKEVGGK